MTKIIYKKMSDNCLQNTPEHVQHTNCSMTKIFYKKMGDNRLQSASEYVQHAHSIQDHCAHPPHKI